MIYVELKQFNLLPDSSYALNLSKYAMDFVERQSIIAY